MRIILAGEAGSGKDTVGNILAEYLGGVCIAQADPMKQFVSKVFGFDEATLWGPSHLRNVPISMTVDELKAFWSSAEFNLMEHAGGWFQDVLPEANLKKLHEAGEELQRWFLSIKDGYNSNLSARVALQTIGTEWGRRVDPTMWNRWALRIVPQLLDGGKGYSKPLGLFEEPSNSAGFGAVIITDGRFRNEVRSVIDVGGIAINVADPEKTEKKTVGVAGHRSESEQKSIPTWWYRMTINNRKSRGIDALRQQIIGVSRALFPEIIAEPYPAEEACPGCEHCSPEPTKN